MKLFRQECNPIASGFGIQRVWSIVEFEALGFVTTAAYSRSRSGVKNVSWEAY
jgi:hypothetical protein